MPKSSMDKVKKRKKSKSKSKPAAVRPSSSSANKNVDMSSMLKASGLQSPDDIVRAHVDSFNWLFGPNGGIDLAVKDIHPVLIDADTERGLPGAKFWIKKVDIGLPGKGDDDSTDTRLWPNECRERRVSYSGSLRVTVCRRVDGESPVELTLKSGDAPIMVKTSRCHLQGLTPNEMVERREEVTEMGGYFVVNGNEKVMRLLILPRRNHVTGLIRPSFANRGALYTPYATTIRCVRPDQTSQTLSVHYLSDGTCTLRVTIQKQEFFTPVALLLHALIGTTDREIFANIVSGVLGISDEDAAAEHSFVSDRVELMLREGRRLGLNSQNAYLTYLGARFRMVLGLPESISDENAGRVLIQRHLFVHCEASDNRAKFDVLVLMLRKLYALVQGRIAPDNADALHMHELLLPGYMFLGILKERLQESLNGIVARIQRDRRMRPASVKMNSDAYIRTCMSSTGEVGQKLAYFMSTGNLVSNSGLDLMQVSGYTIMAEKLNYYRYLSHFRSVHRGAFFSEMKTTTVRKLLPESWGFMCPVHTPDGSPCGLLNHLSASCRVITRPWSSSPQALIALLASLGMLSRTELRARLSTPVASSSVCVVVQLDGVTIGGCPRDEVSQLSQHLRHLKVTGNEHIPETLEIACITSISDGAFPGLYLSTAPARFSRPVMYLPTRSIEFISPLEQVFMHVALRDSDIHSGTKHMEIRPTNMLSAIASLTPFSDHNQSPRNMYQCQMGKQTMGTPFHSFAHRVDNKVYRIQTPQTPLVRTEAYDPLGIDQYPLGTNAVVAVISYTGYDMEDAMIINKSSYERGFGHGTVYTTTIVDLDDLRDSREPIHHRFSNVNPKTKQPVEPTLDHDGLPRIGTHLTQGSPLYCVVNDIDGKAKVSRHKSSEPAYVEEVRALGRTRDGELQMISIKLRYNRNPVIGDKFSSRHGQKGVLSQLWPQEDMPFTEGGLTPDVIINPHAFPSRMTIGMLVESMAGKVSCMSGEFSDGTPFRFNESDRAVDYFGERLRKRGYNYLGNEVLYSGVSGEELQADVFIGVVYYQRLRHMVSDKYQVRSTGPTSTVTHQPIKGRKRGGGIRFGEMERDSLLGHGAAFLLYDRLLRCSDDHIAHVCKHCGSALSALPMSTSASTLSSSAVACVVCKDPRACVPVAMPYVFTYLLSELASMNIKLQFHIKAH